MSLFFFFFAIPYVNVLEVTFLNISKHFLMFSNCAVCPRLFYYNARYTFYGLASL